MEGIQCSDAELQAALAAIRMDNVGPNAKRNNFELAATFLLPTCPVAKKRKSNSSNKIASISGVGGDTGTKVKPSVGKTGLEFRYYKKGEYKRLSEEQRTELREWRANNITLKKKRGDDDDSKDDGRDNKKKWRKEVASVFREELKKHEDSAQKDQEEVNSIKELLVSFASAKTLPPKPNSQAPSPPTGDQVTVAATKLQSILKNNRKGKKD